MARAASASKLPNVYQFLFDAYSSTEFLSAARAGNLAPLLEGFTFFQDNLSNYIVTDASVPSLMTGRLFDGGSFKDFQAEATSGGFRQVLKDAGYRLSLYTPDRSRFWMHDAADEAKTSQDVAGAELLKVVQISLVRLAPVRLRQETLSATEDLISGLGRLRGYTLYKRLSVPLVEQFLQDELSRGSTGNYVYVHVILPHRPFVWNADCSPAAKRSSYPDQVACATLLMKRILRRLDDAGHLANSLVVFQSDHGYHRSEGGIVAFSDPGKEVLEKLAQTSRYYTPEGALRRLNALLLVKPPGADGAFAISRYPSQLADIPATIYDALGIDGPATDGSSLLQLSVDEPRERHVFFGIFDRDADGEPLVLGAGVHEKDLAHLSYTSEVGWRIYPNVRATHEGW
jgi:hypothetical protein